jgi:hypothetical protein
MTALYPREYSKCIPDLKYVGYVYNLVGQNHEVT